MGFFRASPPKRAQRLERLAAIEEQAAIQAARDGRRLRADAQMRRAERLRERADRLDRR